MGALLAAAAKPADRFLEHAITYALIEIADREATAVGLKADSAGTRRAALVALDQMHGEKLSGGAVAAGLRSADKKLRESAWWIAGRRPEHAAAVVPFFRQALADAHLKSAEVDELTGNLSRLRQVRRLGNYSSSVSRPGTRRPRKRAASCGAWLALPFDRCQRRGRLLWCSRSATTPCSSRLWRRSARCPLPSSRERR